MLDPRIKINWKWLTGDGKSEHQRFRNSELKWTGMGEFNLDDHLSTTVGKNPLEEME